MKKTKNKDMKKNNKSLLNNPNEGVRLITVFLIVMLVFAVFYVLTIFIKNGKTEETGKNDGVAVIQYEEILVGEILNQKSDLYYVLIASNEELPTYDTYINNYKNSENANAIYKVDLDSIFNQKYVDDNSNFEFDDLKDIRFKGATLLKIEKHKITEYYEGEEKIVEYLNNL